MDLFCIECNLKFDKKYVFDLHLSSEHGEKIELKSEHVFTEDHVVDTSLKCGTCNSLFNTKQKLKKHIDSVHERKNRNKCNFCGASFVGKRELNRHEASVHEGKNNFQCNASDTSFPQNAQLSRHKASVHEKKKSFKCNT